jgi:pilus assembly protein CpaB
MLMRRLVFLMIAAVISIGTVMTARSWMQSQLAAREQPVAAAPAPAPVQQKQMVLVAKGELPAGLFMRPENLRWQPWPDDGIADSYITEGKGKIEDFIGAVVRSGLNDGEPIADGRVVRPGDRGFMAAVLTPGNRAMTVSVTPSSGLAGFAFPGDRVDVILTMVIELQKQKDAEKEPDRRASETVLTNIRVLAVDQRVDDQKREISVAKTATLEVSPREAEILAVASEMGKLSLSLRSLAHEPDQIADSGASTNASTNTHTWDSDAAQVLRAIPKAPVASAGRKVSVVRGTEAQDIEFSTMSAQ